MLTNKTKHRPFLLTWLAFDALCAVGEVLQWKRVKSWCTVYPKIIKSCSITTPTKINNGMY
ncbi:hypothetical protein I3760_08G132900 [Carya illinoinensis]|nr:hypothetical protein I3760_08G132900 [Carya illinoinensis]